MRCEKTAVIIERDIGDHRLGFVQADRHIRVVTPLDWSDDQGVSDNRMISFDRKETSGGWVLHHTLFINVDHATLDGHHRVISTDCLLNIFQGVNVDFRDFFLQRVNKQCFRHNEIPLKTTTILFYTNFLICQAMLIKFCALNTSKCLGAWGFCMGKLMQGFFVPKNPQKYIGKNIRKIMYRSSWEFSFMTKCDSHPYVLQWASECISISYRHPISGKWTMYIPDFFIRYKDRNLKEKVEILEIKPAKEMPGYIGKTSKNDKLVQIVNAAKWASAIAYCAQRGWTFRIAGSEQLFAYTRGA